MIPFAELSAHLGLSEEDFLEIVKEFVISTDENIEGISAGLSSGDADQVRKRAHSIYEVSVVLGFADIAAKARLMELAADVRQLSGLDGQLAALTGMVDKVKRRIAR